MAGPTSSLPRAFPTAHLPPFPVVSDILHVLRKSLTYSPNTYSCLCHARRVPAGGDRRTGKCRFRELRPGPARTRTATHIHDRRCGEAVWRGCKTAAGLTPSLGAAGVEEGFLGAGTFRRGAKHRDSEVSLVGIPERGNHFCKPPEWWKQGQGRGDGRRGKGGSATGEGALGRLGG